MTSKTDNKALDATDATLIHDLLEDCPWELAKPDFRKDALRLLDKIKHFLLPTLYKRLKKTITDKTPQRPDVEVIRAYAEGNITNVQARGFPGSDADRRIVALCDAFLVLERQVEK